MKHRIVYVITRPERGGAQSHVLELLRGLPDKRRALLICGRDTDMFLADAATELGVRVKVLESLKHRISPLQDLQAVFGLYRLLRAEKPDLVHAHSTKAGLLTRIAARLARVPSVFTAHGWAFAEGASRQRRTLALLLERWAARIGQQIIAVSEHDRALGLHRQVAGTGQLVTVRNGLSDNEQVRQIAAVPGEKFRVVMVARFVPQKDQTLLLRAAALVPGIQLVLVGDGPGLDEARQLAKSLDSDAEFMGSRSDVPALLAGCHAFALISHFEGFPISTLEAMRAALPVIVSDVGGAAEVLDEHETVGWAVPRGDQEALVAVLNQLICDPARADLVGRAARTHFLQHHTTAKMLTRTWIVYNNMTLQS